MRKSSRMIDPGSKSKNGAVVVRKVNPWNPQPKRFVEWDSFGNPIFEAAF